MKLKRVVLNGLVLGFGSLLLIASGGGDSSIEGYLVDSPIKGANYECIEGGSGVTDKDGKFKCKNIPVTFKIGGLEIGTISSLLKDKKVYPQDLIGVSRDNYTDDKLILLTRFLQSLDNDGVISENIDITEEVREKFAIGEFIDLSEDEVKGLLDKVGKNFVSQESALSHLRGDYTTPSDDNPSYVQWVTPSKDICENNGGMYKKYLTTHIFKKQPF